MTRRITFLLVFLSIKVLLAQDTAGAQGRGSRAEEGAIRQRGAAFSAAYVRGDRDAMMECYSEHAVLMPPGMDIISHRDSIRKYWTLAPGRRVTYHKSTPLEIIIVGATAYDHGYYEGAVSRGTDKPIPFKGKYLIVWIKEADNTWRMKRDIWNSLTPTR